MPEFIAMEVGEPLDISGLEPEAADKAVEEAHRQRGALGLHLTAKARSKAYHEARATGASVDDARKAMDAVKPIVVKELEVSDGRE